MNTTTTALVAAVIAYLIGSLPFGYLVARLFKGIDIRTQGSGNIGATNVARILGAKWGLLVFFLDAVKGILPVLLLPRLLLPTGDSALMHLIKFNWASALQTMLQPAGDPALMHFEVLCGVATVLGHIFPVWLKFKGGKGVATSAGVVVVISTQATLIAFAVYCLMFWWKRIGSLASLAAAVTFATAHVVLVSWKSSLLDTTELSRTLFALLMPLVIIFCHRKNLVRLVQGKEPKFGEQAAKPNPVLGKDLPQESHQGL